MIKLPRPYLAFDSVLCEALQHNLSGLVPPPHHPSTLYPLPTVVFRMFDYTDCPEGPILPGQHSIERWLIEEQLNHILMSGFTERKEVDCAAALLPPEEQDPPGVHHREGDVRADIWTAQPPLSGICLWQHFDRAL